MIWLAISTATAHAVDEIQVYTGEIAKVGQWTMQLHLNYAIDGRKEPDFLPGGLIPTMRSKAPGNGPMASPTGGRWGSMHRLRSTRT